jgi:hypothetical protein
MRNTETLPSEFLKEQPEHEGREWRKNLATLHGWTPVAPQHLEIWSQKVTCINTHCEECKQLSSFLDQQE